MPATTTCQFIELFKIVWFETNVKHGHILQQNDAKFVFSRQIDWESF